MFTRIKTADAAQRHLQKWLREQGYDAEIVKSFGWSGYGRFFDFNVEIDGTMYAAAVYPNGNIAPGQAPPWPEAPKKPGWISPRKKAVLLVLFSALGHATFAATITGNLAYAFVGLAPGFTIVAVGYARKMIRWSILLIAFYILIMGIIFWAAIATLP